MIVLNYAVVSLVESHSNLRHLFRHPDVVAIKEADDVALDQFESHIEGRCLPAVFLVDRPNAGISLGMYLDHAPRVVGRTIIHHDNVKIPVGLVACTA